MLESGQNVNRLDAEVLSQRLDVWATLVFEEFWNGYGMGGGVVYQDCEKYPVPPLLKDLQSRGVGLNAVREETLNFLQQQGKPLLPHLIDFEADYSLAKLVTEEIPASAALLNFLTFEDLYALLAENQEDNLVQGQQLPTPSTHQVINICLTDYTDTPDWMRFKQILKFAHIESGVAKFPLWESENASLTLQLQVWGKLLDPYKPLPTSLFRDLLKLANLGLTQLDYAIFYDYGFNVQSFEIWSVPTSQIDYTQQIREMADKLRKFMQNKDTQAAGLKFPQILVINPPLVDAGLLQGTGLPEGDFWAEAPTYAIWGGQQLPEPFTVGE